jgi:electron transfer flavoprotein beta subunit
VTAPLVAVCWKVVELRAAVDPLTGEVLPDPSSLGPSPADEAALEWALRCADAAGGRVRVVTAGGAEAEATLRLAAACGAAELVRVAMPAGAHSEDVARALEPELRDAELVWCGDLSRDRGSGSVPAFLAALLGLPQALGLVGIEIVEEAEVTGWPIPALTVTRRLERGRRERLVVDGRAVLSCEGSVARLRRAPLDRLLGARRMPVELRAAPGAVDHSVRTVAVRPYRPAPRVVPPPPGVTASERVRALTGVASTPRPARAVRLDPPAAAGAILEALESWGELP